VNEGLIILSTAFPKTFTDGRLQNFSIMQKKSAQITEVGKQMDSPKVEAIVFDAYGTLFDLESFARDAEKVHRGKGKEIARIVRQKQLEFAMTRTILGKYADFETLTRNAIEFALK